MHGFRNSRWYRSLMWIIGKTSHCRECRKMVWPGETVCSNKCAMDFLNGL